MLSVVLALALTGCTRLSGPEVDADAVLAGLPTRTIAALVDTLPDEILAGQLIMVGLEGRQDGRSRPRLDDELRTLLSTVQPGGVVLFSESFVSPEQIRDLVAGTHAELEIPALIATDHEGGLVTRLPEEGELAATPIPPAAMVERALERGAPERLPYALGGVIGAELRATGVTMNLAPVVDVNPPGSVGSIGRHGRTYSDDPRRAGELAGAVASGMRERGVVATLKHFPGHGGVLEDTHEEAAVLLTTIEEWEARELVAFQAAAAAEPGAVMTAHISLPALTGDPVPATIAGEIVARARAVAGPNAVLMTDALNMRAIRSYGSEPEIAVQALVAGHDLLLKPLDAVAVRDAILAALDTGELSRERIEESARRLLLLKYRVGLLGPPWLTDPALISPDPARMREVLGNGEHLGIVGLVQVEEEP